MEKNLSFQNNNIRYQVLGDGVPVMLVHGFGEDSSVWDRQVPQLQKRFRIILPDLPGSGQSGLNPDVSMENMAAVLDAIIDEEGLDAITMLGHSMGGYVTLAFAEKYPGKLRALGLVHSTAYADTDEKRATRKKAIEFMRNHGVEEFLKTSAPNLFSTHTKEHEPSLVDEVIQRYKNMDVNALIAYYEAMMRRPDRQAVLRDFGRPVLFLAGEHDTTIPFDQVVQQSSLPLLSYLHVLHRSGHMGIWEEPNESTYILEEYIKNNVL